MKISGHPREGLPEVGQIQTRGLYVCIIMYLSYSNILLYHNTYIYIYTCIVIYYMHAIYFLMKHHFFMVQWCLISPPPSTKRVTIQQRLSQSWVLQCMTIMFAIGTVILYYHIHDNVYIYIYTYIHISTHYLLVYIYICIYTYIYIHIYIHVYLVYTYTYTYVLGSHGSIPSLSLKPRNFDYQKHWTFSPYGICGSQVKSVTSWEHPNRSKWDQTIYSIATNMVTCGPPSMTLETLIWRTRSPCIISLV